MLELVGPLGTINNTPAILASTSDILLWTKCPDRMYFPHQSLNKWQNTNHRLYLEKCRKSIFVTYCNRYSCVVTKPVSKNQCCYWWVKRDGSYLLCSIRVNCESSVCHSWAIKEHWLAIKVGWGVEQINTEAIPTDQGWLMPDTCQMNQKISNSATYISRLPVYIWSCVCWVEDTGLGIEGCTHSSSSLLWMNAVWSSCSHQAFLVI